MNAPVLSRRAMLGATAAVGTMSMPAFAGTAIPVSLPADPDAALFRLLAGLPGLKARRDATAARQDALWAEFCRQEPERPDALRVRPSDGSWAEMACENKTRDGEWVWFYEVAAAAELRDLPRAALQRREWRDGRWVTVPDEARIARRDEIVAALDRWWDECDVVKERLGIPRADEIGDAASDALHSAWEAISATAPATFPGLVAKARWVTAADMPTGLAERWVPQIARDVVAMAGRGGGVS